MSQTPQTPDQWRAYAQQLYAAGDLGGAEAAFVKSFGADGPQTWEDHLGLARFAIFMSDYKGAAAACETAATLSPGNPDIHLTAARIALFTGDMATCRAETEAGLAAAPDHPDLLYMALDNFKVVPDGLFQRAERVAATSPSPTLTFALARTLDRAGDYERAWAMAAAANARQAAQLRPGTLPFDPRHVQARVRAAIEIYKSLEPTEDTGLAPIYFTGSPRCGGTLIETILAAHPEIETAGERGALVPWMSTAISKGPRWLQAERAQLAVADISGLRAAGISGRSVIDKTPANAEIAGLLARVHPAARFVDIDRDIRDIAVSIFFREFPQGYPYSMRLEDIVTYLRLRRAMIKAWAEAGLEIISVRYEEFVSLPERGGSELFKALGLLWSRDYLDPSARTAPARTFSAQQVRAPVSTTAVGKWERFASQFQALIDQRPETT